MITLSDLGLSVFSLTWLKQLVPQAIRQPDLKGARYRMAVNGRFLERIASNTGSSPADDEWLTVDDVCRIIKVGRRTFDRYLSHGTGPRVKRLDGGKGGIRIRREWLDAWMDDAA